VEIPLPEGTLFVSKTDARGVIVYADHTFIRVSGYSEEELISSAHSIVRHPDMPRSLFWYFWNQLQAGNEVFAYVVNLAKNGDHYWVLAHATPDFHPVTNAIIGYHSCRRAAPQAAVNRVMPIYRQIIAEEKRARPHDQCATGMAVLERILAERGLTYEQWIFAIHSDTNPHRHAA
ncbi:MAG: PAS domain-containing protein, partial [Myxococcales bacterium]|nr:PAS domain-containing protein [Myxococcales bacterium]